MSTPDYLKLYGFTYSNEVLVGISNRPHWPGGDSGLTLGPGYNIGSRRKEDVIAFLRDELGLPEAAVSVFADGSGLTGEDARRYLSDHSGELDLLQLSPAQEKQIFLLLAPEYEKRVRRVLRRSYPEMTWDSLDEHQKCLLFDYEYNVGLGKFPRFVAAFLAQDWAEARRQCIRKGLEGKRRETETFAYLDRLNVTVA
jgi:hypothetical protein